MEALSIRAFAKVNLALAVAPAEDVGPKKGWHRICSWMHAIELHDDVRVEVDPALHGPRLDIRWAQDAPLHAGEPVAWPADKDLALRAATLLKPDAPLNITIRKRIPDGGGLGGGSSNAAAVLIAASTLLELDNPFERLRELSARLGSDVAFFIDDADNALHAPPRPALVSGFGQTIERLAPPAERTDLTLAFPAMGCHTAEIYRAFDQLDPGPLRDATVRSLAVQRPGEAALFNDLTPAAHRVHPELADLQARLQQRWSRPVHMSGSGSTLFALGKHPAIDECVTHHTQLARQP